MGRINSLLLAGLVLSSACSTLPTTEPMATKAIVFGTPAAGVDGPFQSIALFTQLNGLAFGQGLRLWNSGFAAGFQYPILGGIGGPGIAGIGGIGYPGMDGIGVGGIGSPIGVGIGRPGWPGSPGRQLMPGRPGGPVVPGRPSRPGRPGPVVTPSPAPTAAPTAEPTMAPTAAPTAEPTMVPTAAPTAEPGEPTPGTGGTEPPATGG
jgi:hypothetical protein